LEVDPNQFVRTLNYAKVVTVPNISENRINGIEFDPNDSKVLHIAAGKDDISNVRNGLNTIDFSNWDNQSTQSNIPVDFIPVNNSYAGT
jgi:hypothetical protein